MAQRTSRARTAASGPGAGFTTRPVLTGTFGMVASTHWLASAAGMAMLERGGNAFDAAVAAGMVLQVVEPHMCGPGGEVPVIGYAAASGRAFVLDGQGPAPAAATPAVFAELGLSLIPGTGLLPATVPAAFGTWMLLLSRYGTMRPRDVMEHAIGYAAAGYPIPAAASAAIAAMADTFAPHWPGSAAVYLHAGVPPPGSRFANPALASCYGRILAAAEAASGHRLGQIEAARRAFYEGFVAAAIDEFTAGGAVPDIAGRRHQGLLSGADLAGWRASEEPPASLEFRGLTVCKTGPWGQGPVFLQQLALLDGLGPDRLEPGSPELVHLITEAAKLAFADREAWYGDPRRTPVPVAELLSSRYAALRRGLITESASAELRPGSPGGAEPRLPGHALGGQPPGPAASRPGDGAARTWHTGHGAGEPLAGLAGPPHGDTCHLDAADRFGNVVSATPSGGWLQSSPVIPGLGFCLGTRGQMFTLTPGLASSLAPGRRPRTTLSPTLVLRGGEPYLAFGTPGGDQQDQWTVSFFLNHVLYGMDLQRAIDAPAFHTAHFPSSFYPRDCDPGSLSAESRLGRRCLEALRNRGHRVRVMPPWSLGRICAVASDRGMLYAAASPRGMQCYAAGR